MPQDETLAKRLRRVRKFADTWHQTAWQVSALPTELHARLLLFDEEASILGVAASAGRGRNAIGLNARLADQPMLSLLVLAHEAAHLVDGDLIGLCSLDDMHTPRESRAWLGASLLAVSRQIVPVEDAAASDLAELAGRCMVPAPLLAVRSHLAVLLGERPGDVNVARAGLAFARLSFVNWFGQRLSELSA